MTRGSFLTVLFAGALALAGCGERESGPIDVSAAGAPPQLRNPNLEPLDAASAFLVEAAAQGLVRFDAEGEIEPALAQSWIVSDDGLRYTFRIRRAMWADGSRVTAAQVAGRLRAASSRASRNPFKSVLGAIVEVEPMTDQVLEISLSGPRPNLLQLLAQPELGILRDNLGTGPFLTERTENGAVRLARPQDEEEEEEDVFEDTPIVLRGESMARAVARFAEEDVALVVGGTIADLPIARAARLSQDRLVFDPAAGLFGLAFARAEEGPLADAGIRRALSMAIDREALVATLAVPGLQPRSAWLPPVGDELPRPGGPDWAGAPLPMRRQLAARAIAALDEPLTIRVAIPATPGHRLIFAHLRRDWRLIGVAVERVPAGAPAELVLIDSVAPAQSSSWYLRHFTCDTGRVCDAAADEALEAARAARTAAERRVHLAQAHQLLVAGTPFIPLTAPLRWSLVSPRLTGFRPNRFARHPAETLIAEEN